MMFKRVILRATEGELKGKIFTLENETESILGRSRDCSVSLEDPLYRVSRHHCRILVFAPYVRIQDLGSLNGTYVNGERIGQRHKGQSFTEALLEEHADYPLWHGDMLTIGDTVFEVELDPPPPCATAEARDPEKLWSGDCAACR